MAAFAAIVVSVLLWQLGDPRRVLAYTVPVSDPLLSSHWDGMPGELQVTLTGEPIADPYIVVVEIDLKGRRDVRSSDFDQDRPLVIDLGARLIGASWSGTATMALETVGPGESSISLGPALIAGGQGLRLTLITDGKPEIAWKSPIAGVKVRKVDDEPMNWHAISALLLGGGAAIYSFVGLLTLTGHSYRKNIAIGTVEVAVSLILIMVSGALTVHSRPRRKVKSS